MDAAESAYAALLNADADFDLRSPSPLLAFLYERIFLGSRLRRR